MPCSKRLRSMVQQSSGEKCPVMKVKLEPSLAGHAFTERALLQDLMIISSVCCCCCAAAAAATTDATHAGAAPLAAIALPRRCSQICDTHNCYCKQQWRAEVSALLERKSAASETRQVIMTPQTSPQRFPAQLGS